LNHPLPTEHLDNFGNYPMPIREFSDCHGIGLSASDCEANVAAVGWAAKVM
jgi:hypothetical protein